jgi:drug/metabolite transporter (DMT)-like permease
LAALFLLSIALLIEGPPNLPSLSGLLAVGYLGLVPTALAFVIKVAVIRSTGPSFMTHTN